MTRQATKEHATRTTPKSAARAHTHVARAPVAPVQGPSPRVLIQRACKCASPGPLGATCERCGGSNLVVQRAARAPAPAPAPLSPAPLAHLSSALGSGGRPLGGGVRSFMERGFGHDFGAVRVHTGPAAERSTEAMGARAYTLGNDIVFNRGEYRPDTKSGRRLLAHELAHTVQQGGLQQKSDAPLSGPTEARLEAEADRAADAVIRGDRPNALSRVAGSAPLRATKKEPEDPGENRAWKKAPPSLSSIASEVSEVLSEGSDRAMAVRLKKPFALPPEKGKPGLALWKAKADAGALETIWDRKRVALYQARDSSNLRPFWLEKVGWSKDDAPKAWHELRKKVDPKTPAKVPSEFSPEVSAGTCHMDHVVELQMQGTNVASNIAVLDGGHNTSSGSQIRAYIEATANEVIANLPPGDKFLDVIVLRWDKVEQASAVAPGPCAQIEALAVKQTGGDPGGEVPDGKERYELKSGGATGWVDVDKAKSGAAKDADISTSNVSQLVPGLALKTLHRPKSKHHVNAGFDERGKTRVPITLDKTAPIALDVLDGGELKLREKDNKNLKFHFPYLSTGTIKKLEITPEGISGVGELIPSVPLLKNLVLQVHFGPDRLEITGGLDPKKLKLPIPGFEITKAEISMLLYPELKPSGTIGFQIASRGKKAIEGALTLGADAQGFFAKGEIRAFLPGVDEARGELVYRKSGWTGNIHVEGSKFKLPVVTVKQGALDVRLADGGVEADGRLLIGLPRDQEAELKLSYARGQWLFRGTGLFRVPPLKDFTAWVTYDGKNVAAGGKTSLAYRGFVAAVEIDYLNGKVRGKGTIDFEKGRVKGRAEVEIDDALRLSGKGSVTVKINEDLVATAGIELRKDGGVRLTGVLSVVKPIVLFKGFSDKANLFSLKKSFPVPALSIGPLGVQAVLGGSLDLEYAIGPAALVGTTLALAFDPFDDKPDVEIGVKSSLLMTASAGISATITGGLELEAGLARAGGEVAVTGGAKIAGKAGGDLDILYKQKKILVKASAGIEAGLRLTLAIKATVYGEVGVWKFKKRWSKSWDLYDKVFDTGLRFKLTAPFSYASGEGPKLPSLSEVQFEKPKLSLGEVVDRLAKDATQKERET
jgi:hypothetical protein